MANDGNIISIALAAGAEKELTAVSGLKRDVDVISLKYGDSVRSLNSVSDEYMNLENVIAADPQVVFAGWGYGFSEEKNLTPQALNERNISAYTLSESCRTADGKRGTMNPWEALDTDIRNIGKITGNEKAADKTADEIAAKVKELEALPKADKEPVGFVFDSASDTVFTSGNMGAPQAMMDTAGVKNALEDVDDTWTKVSWERLAAADPDIIFFVDYPPQTFEEKIAALESNPVSKNLRAVKEKRFVNLPYAMWTSGPLNVEGAEYMRMALEYWELAPKTDTTSELDIRKLDSLPGNDWLK
uniref:ABC transporter substrate-binding protein n=1 Tax=Vaginimicrobium propionicum TaxID=1871034 RepID=UPI001E53224C|nr:ABC transporter substrate-binding protein [Vaginimicrobium propionicum]